MTACSEYIPAVCQQQQTSLKHLVMEPKLLNPFKSNSEADLSSHWYHLQDKPNCRRCLWIVRYGSARDTLKRTERHSPQPALQKSVHHLTNRKKAPPSVLHLQLGFKLHDKSNPMSSISIYSRAALGQQALLTPKLLNP